MTPLASSLTWAVLATAGVGLVGWAVVRSALDRHVAAAPTAALLVTVGSMTAGVIAAGSAMLLGPGQLRTLGIVLAVSGCIALGLGFMLGRSIAATQRQAAEQAELQRIAAQRDADRRESMAWISHDLRSPLARMRAMAEAMSDGIGGGPDHYLPMMSREITLMTAMVDDLLTVSRLQLAGTAKRERFDVADIVSDAIAAAQPLGAQAGILVTGKGEAGVDVNADAAALTRAVTNLVENALRHTHAGGTVVVSSQGEGREVGISVTDECGGIDPEQVQRIFEPGWRADSARQQDSAGAGLGLTIVAAVAAAHHGRVDVRNTGTGCTFTLHLPRADQPH